MKVPSVKTCMTELSVMLTPCAPFEHDEHCEAHRSDVGKIQLLTVLMHFHSHYAIPVLTSATQFCLSNTDQAVYYDKAPSLKAFRKSFPNSANPQDLTALCTQSSHKLMSCSHISCSLFLMKNTQKPQPIQMSITVENEYVNKNAERELHA